MVLDYSYFVRSRILLAEKKNKDRIVTHVVLISHITMDSILIAYIYRDAAKITSLLIFSCASCIFV